MASSSAPKLESMQLLKNAYEIFTTRGTMYIGINTPQTVETTVLHSSGRSFVTKMVTLIPSFVKVIDEAILNASDAMHNFKDLGMDLSTARINFDFDPEEDKITIQNFSPHSIEIREDVVDDYGNTMWLPQSVFTKLHMSTNFNKEEKSSQSHKGGCNGIGTKAITYTSELFDLEIVNEGVKYSQRFTNRCKDISEDVSDPVIKNAKVGTPDYVKVSFIPDLGYFNTEGQLLTPDVLAFVKKRCYDVALLNPGVKIYLNGELLKVTRESYFSMLGFSTGAKASMLTYSKEFDENGKKNNITYFIFDNPEEDEGLKFQLLLNGLFINKSSLYKNLMDEFIPFLSEATKKDGKSKKNRTAIQNNLAVFCIANITKVEFKSQTKDVFDRPKIKLDFPYGDNINTIKKMNIWKICNDLDTVDDFKALEDTKGKKLAVGAIDKFDDAPIAGKKRPKGVKATLVLTEGDSAKACVTKGMTAKQRNSFGVYKLMGKPINVKRFSYDKIAENKEFNEMKTILGLKNIYDDEKNEKDNAISKLRYDEILIVSDQDHDGAHIRGLLVNMFNYFWPHLVKQGFIKVLRTPIVNLYKESKVGTGPKAKTMTTLQHSFYTLKKYEEFIETKGLKGLIPRYIKGLGSLSDSDSISVFKTYSTYTLTKDDLAEENLDKVFAKDKADDRKDWINYTEEAQDLDEEAKEIEITDLLDTEVRNYSRYNTSRALVHYVDGFKVSQRKIMHLCFKDNRFTPAGVETKKQIKVVQLGGDVSKKTNYHHGENSLYGAINGLAQDFIGSNNLNPLLPFGQFGSRTNGADGASAPRYLFTAGNDIMKKVFREEDMPLQELIIDDGEEIEPRNMIPILPYILFNGSMGIGSGFSCNIPQYHPLEVLDSMRTRILNKVALEELQPWFKYSKCTYQIIDKNDYDINSIDEDYIQPNIWQFGEYSVDGDVVTITDIPPRFTFDDVKKYYKTICEDYVEALAFNAAKNAKGGKASKVAKEAKGDEMIMESFCFKETGTSCNISIVLKPKFTAMINSMDKKEKLWILSKLKLVDTKNLTFSNAWVLTEDDVIVKLRGTAHVTELFYKYRFEQYKKRKVYTIGLLERNIKFKKYIAKFIRDFREKRIDVANAPEAELEKFLVENGYPRYSGEGLKRVEDPENGSFSYLTGITVRQLTLSKAQKFDLEVLELEKELEAYRSKKISTLWLEELAELEEALEEYTEKVGEDWAMPFVTEEE